MALCPGSVSLNYLKRPVFDCSETGLLFSVLRGLPLNNQVMLLAAG